MYRVCRRIAVALGLMLIGAVIAVALLYRAASAPVPEYQQLLAQTDAQLDTGDLEQSREEFESQIAAVYSQAQSAEAWKTVVTAAQINGWLATRLEETLPELEQSGVSQPRVLLATDGATLAMQVDVRGFAGVVRLTALPMVTDEGWIALELVSAKIGNAPLPTGAILREVQSKLGSDLPLRLAKINARDVLLVDFERIASTPSHVRKIEAIELADGEVRIAGETHERETRVAQAE